MTLVPLDMASDQALVSMNFVQRLSRQKCSGNDLELLKRQDREECLD